jgi:CheY-like chemotaxis protein
MTELTRPSILLVDDEPTVRDVLRRWLEPAGYATRQAEHSRAALAMIADSPPTVVVCDVEMPGPNGLWLIGQLRERFPSVAVVLCTHVDDVTPSISLQGAVVAYVLKPFRQAQVLAAVAQAVAWQTGAAARASTATPDGIDAWLAAQER